LGPRQQWRKRLNQARAARRETIARLGRHHVRRAQFRQAGAQGARRQVGGGLWARLTDAFEEPARIELMMLAGFYRTVSLLVNGLRLESEPFAEPFPSV
jgi:hypothetical protein